MVCTDVENLKKINDNFGHDAGDGAIIKVAKKLQSVFGDQVPCFRTGGDEFCLLIISPKKPMVEKLIAQVESELEEYNKSSGLPYKVQCSSSFCTV
jgi:diguanylate cyclase (GGDEF)-like protein